MLGPFLRGSPTIWASRSSVYSRRPHYVATETHPVSIMIPPRSLHSGSLLTHFCLAPVIQLAFTLVYAGTDEAIDPVLPSLRNIQSLMVIRVSFPLRKQPVG
jgi:hypothetical protein